MKAAIYLRTSTARQSAENQRPDVLQLVGARRLELVAEYTEQASTARRRPAFDRMLEDARRGVFSVLVVWALDRFGRSMVGNLAAVLELDRIGVQVVSVREPWLDTGGPVRSLLVAIFSWVAEQERARLGERTRAGLERALARGKTLGRPKRTIAKRELARARALLAGGSSVRFAAKTIRVPASTLHRALNGKVGT
jgi:DNA invertase Pin-like site-specific DNA recombinase